MERGIDPGLKRTLTWIAGVVAAATAVAIPALYLYTAHSYESDRIQHVADAMARTVSEFVFTYPDSWIFNEHLQQKILLEGRAHGQADLHRLIDREGRLIAEAGTLPAAPTVLRTSDISDGFEVVGRVEIVESLRHVWRRAGLATIAGAVLALAMFAALRVLPLRALTRAMRGLERAHAEIRALNEGLEQRVVARTAELKEAQDELLRKERLATLGQLTATVSHELRNPLGTIRSSIYSVDKKTRGQGLGVEPALDRAERGVVRCADIIEELLDFTRTHELARQPTAIDRWIDNMLGDYTLPAGVGLRLALASGAEAWIDRERLRRVLINLADNACQAMTGDGAREAEGERLLTVESMVAEGRVEITVGDTGSGMPADVLERVFEPLFTTKGFGVGLGLPMVKRIVEQHGGDISIVSDDGRGTRVVFWLPLTQMEKGAA